MKRPKWWPQNPYPKEIFPMERNRYPEIVPDPDTRTALSGMLGREFWEIASNKIWEAIENEIEQDNVILLDDNTILSLPEEEVKK